MINRTFIESELASVRAQQQQAAAVIQQMIGAEKALLALLDQFDEAKSANPAARKAKTNGAANTSEGAVQ